MCATPPSFERKAIARQTPAGQAQPPGGSSSTSEHWASGRNLSVSPSSTLPRCFSFLDVFGFRNGVAPRGYQSRTYGRKEGKTKWVAQNNNHQPPFFSCYSLLSFTLPLWRKGERAFGREEAGNVRSVGGAPFCSPEALYLPIVADCLPRRERGKGACLVEGLNGSS